MYTIRGFAGHILETQLFHGKIGLCRCLDLHRSQFHVLRELLVGRLLLQHLAAQPLVKKILNRSIQELFDLVGEDIAPLKMARDWLRWQGHLLTPGKRRFGRLCCLAPLAGRAGDLCLLIIGLHIRQSPLLDDNPPVQSQHGRPRRLRPALLAAAMNESLAQFARVQLGPHQLLIYLGAVELHETIALCEEFLMDLLGPIFGETHDHIVKFGLLLDAQMFGLNGLGLNADQLFDVALLKDLLVFGIIGVGGETLAFARLLDAGALLEKAVDPLGAFKFDFFC